LPALHRAGPGRPSHVDIPSRVDVILSQGLVPLEGFTWHGCPRLPALHRAGPRRPSHAGIPSRVAFVWSRGPVPLEGFTRHGCPRLPALHRAGPGRPSHADIPSRVAFVSSRGSPRSRVLLAWQGTRAFKCLAVVAAVLQRGRAILGAAAARARSGRRCRRT
jgi:hypothetical protein